jgi:hypothetical protein
MTDDGRYGSISGAASFTYTDVLTRAMASLMVCSAGSADLTSSVAVVESRSARKRPQPWHHRRLLSKLRTRPDLERPAEYERPPRTLPFRNSE